MSGLVSVALISAARTSEAEILITSDVGNTWDWLIGARPLNVSPGETRFDALQLLNNPFAGPVTGTVQLQVDCCKDIVSRAAVTPSGLSVTVCGTQTREILRNQRVFVMPDCTTTAVGVTPTAPGQAFLVVEASNAAVSGGFIATINADSTAGRSSKEVFVNVLPAQWPGNGPAPACATGLEVISLASISPTPLVWKLTNPDQTSYQFATAFTGANSPGGLSVKIVAPGGTAPIPRNTAIITLKNTKGWPVGMRTVNSGNCGLPGQKVTVAEGETKSISVNAGSTTTLVFSKSTCRTNINWFGCWLGTDLGLDDIVVLSEGPFWSLFGGRKVEIETAGDWGAISTAVRGTQ